MHRRRSSREEIERKFLVTTLPDRMDLASLPKKDITQSYLIVTEGKNELRIRQEADAYYLTVKYGQGMVRGQPEIRLTREQFDTLWDSHNEDKLSKTRHFVRMGRRTAHLDVYKGGLEGLVTAEVEFKSRKEALKFRPPWWFGREVTHDHAYRNSALALRRGPITERLVLKSELDRGFDELCSRVLELRRKREGPIVVLIAGGSASGKTKKVAVALHEKFRDDSVLISIDDYYKDGEYIRAHGFNLDEPGALDLELLKLNLDLLKNQKRSAYKPVYDFVTAKRNQDLEEVEPKRLIIVEGLFALNRKIAGFGDITAFVDASAHGRMIRRLMRDAQEREWAPFRTLRYITKVAEPMYRAHVLPTRASADIVIKNEYSPAIESMNAGASQVQVKYPAPNVTHELLRKAGFTWIASVKQSDRYFAPEDGTFTITGEAVRIRQEGERTIFTYKGPRVGDQKEARRYVFSFEVDKETENLLSSIYSKQPIAVVLKDERAIYYSHRDGILLTFDTGIAVGTGTDVKHLSSHVEVQRPQNPEGERRVREALERIGLGQAKGTLESYSKMIEIG